MISVSGFGEFSSGSVQIGAFSAMFSEVAENVATVKSYTVYDLIYCLYLKNMKQVCDEILNQRKCVYLQRQ